MENFLNNFISKSAEVNQEEDVLKKIKQEREATKNSIRENLRNMSFTPSEMSEVFMIIDASYVQMEEVKQKLIKAPPGSDLEPIANEVKSEVKSISTQMLTNLRKKVDEIRARKGL